MRRRSAGTTRRRFIVVNAVKKGAPQVWPDHAGNVLFDGTDVIRYDKRQPAADMKFIDYGLGVLNSDLLGAHTDEAFDLSDIYAALANEGRLAGFEATKRFYEIGTPSGLGMVSSPTTE